MKILLMSQWASGFFGRPAGYSATLHKEIFALVYYGGGGFTFSDVYEMPIYLRKFYFKELTETKQREKKDTKKDDIIPGQVPKFVPR